MVAAIAKENKLSPLVSPRLEGIIVDHIDQTEESDLAFLNRVAQTVDSYVKPADGKLIVALIGTAISPKKEEKPMPTTELDVTDINSWRIRIAERNKINSVEVKYHDKKKGILDTVRTGKGKPCFCVPHTYASATTAMRIAKSKLAALIRGIYELELTVAGNTAICAESIIKISNLTQAANGEWIIKSATHELSNSGYVTQINAIIKD